MIDRRIGALILANARIGHELTRSAPGRTKVPMHAQASATERVLFHVTEMCCLSETFTGVYLKEMLARTTDAVARVAIESLLEDEIDHGRVGWTYLAERAGQRRTGGLDEALPAMLDRVFGRVLGRGRVGTRTRRRSRGVRIPGPRIGHRRLRERTSPSHPAGLRDSEHRSRPDATSSR
jgi:hypothetical protein